MIETQMWLVRWLCPYCGLSNEQNRDRCRECGRAPVKPASLSASTDRELLVEAKALLIELRSYAASMESFCVVHHWEPNAELGLKLTNFLARLAATTEAQ